jgi:hypothetical protein
MVTCPWCEEGSEALLADAEVFECAACGTCVELVEEAPALDVAA